VGRIVELIPGAVRGTLLLLDPAADKLLLAAFVSPDEPAVSETLARRALQKQQAFIWRNRFGTDHALSINRHQIQSGMYAPLIYNGWGLGVLCVDNPDCQSAFSEEHLQLLVAVADHAAVAVSYSRLREELATKSILFEEALSHLPLDVRNRLIERARQGKR
jgi:GAF domain-containing protein